MAVMSVTTAEAAKAAASSQGQRVSPVDFLAHPLRADLCEKVLHKESRGIIAVQHASPVDFLARHHASGGRY